MLVESREMSVRPFEIPNPFAKQGAEVSKNKVGEKLAGVALTAIGLILFFEGIRVFGESRRFSQTVLGAAMVVGGAYLTYRGAKLILGKA